MSSCQLAQINIARLLAPIDDPLIADFVADIDRINHIAENSKGFIWRLKDEAGNATSFNPFNDPLIIVNVSVWETIEDLKNFAFRSDHLDVYLKRAKWFEKMKEPNLAMWWIQPNQFPTAEQAAEKLYYLRTNGESNLVFSFKKTH